MQQRVQTSRTDPITAWRWNVRVYRCRKTNPRVAVDPVKWDGGGAMYHYDPETALEELKEDALLPKPAHIRDMIIRSNLQADQARISITSILLVQVISR